MTRLDIGAGSCSRYQGPTVSMSLLAGGEPWLVLEFVLSVKASVFNLPPSVDFSYLDMNLHIPSPL